MKYLIIGALATVVGLIFAIILDAAIDLWEQWHEEE